MAIKSDLNLTAFEDLFIDPISHKIMKEPVRAPCGHVFEQKQIVGWLKNESNKCPLDGKPLMENILNTSVAIKRALSVLDRLKDEASCDFMVRSLGTSEIRVLSTHETKQDFLTTEEFSTTENDSLTTEDVDYFKAARTMIRARRALDAESAPAASIQDMLRCPGKDRLKSPRSFDPNDPVESVCARIKNIVCC